MVLELFVAGPSRLRRLDLLTPPHLLPEGPFSSLSAAAAGVGSCLNSTRLTLLMGCLRRVGHGSPLRLLPEPLVLDLALPREACQLS